MPERHANDKQLKSEIVSLVQYIKRFREEIAHMVAADGNQTRFETMADQLDAIVGATETATHSILEHMESVDGLVEEIRTTDDPKARGALCDQISEKTMEAIEACTFQDITGQRVTKIVRSMKFVEERVNKMIDLWGHDEINRLASEFAQEDKPQGDDALLNGPALQKEASISQDEIDKLFD
ncbi:MAG: protein phosphatase CheZ [Alphaproteobacteria bacterium]|nr:protein phosphatase CheZ [Alphaproteobacteria bacterium]